MPPKSIYQKKGWPLLCILCCVIINIGASRWHQRIDLTAEKRFTISASGKQLLKQIGHPLDIIVFLKGNYPSGFQKLASTTEDFMRHCRETAGASFRYRFMSPDETVPGTSVTYADTLQSMGVHPINLTSQLKEGQQQLVVYPVALLNYENRQEIVQIYKGKTPLISFQELNSAEAMMEYQFLHGIAKLIRTENPSIAYAIGNGEPTDIRVYDLAEHTLRQEYQLQLVNLSEQAFIHPGFKALIIAKPSIPFTDMEKLKIDQYIMHGGKVLFFMDRLDAEMDSLQILNQVIAYDRQLNLQDMLFRYGVRVNADLLMDLQCDYLPFDVNGNGQFDFLPWNYFPVLESSENHPINKNLGFVSGKFVNTLDTVESKGIRKTILLQSSNNSRSISAPALISGNENVNTAEDAKFNKAHLPVALLLEGRFRSFFSNRLSKEMSDSLKSCSMDYLSTAQSHPAIMVAGDGDLVLNAVARGNQPIPMGMNPFTYGTQREFPFSNKDFLLNTLDYMIDRNGLMEAKSKDYVVKLLDSKKVNEEKLNWQLFNTALPVVIVVLGTFIFHYIRRRQFIA